MAWVTFLLLLKLLWNEKQGATSVAFYCFTTKELKKKSYILLIFVSWPLVDILDINFVLIVRNKYINSNKI